MLLHGNCLDRLKELPDNSIDSIVTDPPYGLSFMGKKWDYDVPSVEIWREALRVLKPGGHLLSFGGTRTYHRLVVNIEDAGFEIRDQIQWLYGSGFPKSHNIKEGEFKGFGTALKPANEPICVARKPLERGLTVAENVLKYGTGAINIDASRIGTEDIIKSVSNNNIKGNSYASNNSEKQRDTTYNQSHQGRWPANLILDEAAAEMLDEQSGPCKTGVITKPPTQDAKNIFKGKKPFITASHIDNSTGASRFFYVAKASKSERNRGLEGMPKVQRNITEGHGRGKINTSKGDGAGIRENRPCENFHPTVKPIKLMSYLIKLVTPPNGTVLDPFMGSGSTGVAAKELGFKFIGIEMNEEYLQIAEKRMEAAV